MTASAPIVGTLPTIPDAASAPLPDSGVPTHADFRSVLEQYHASPDSDSNSDDPKSAREQKHKDFDPATTLAVTHVVLQPVTPAVEAPRLILPFTTSFTLRQDATASPDDTVLQGTNASADDTATQNTTAAADPKTVSTPVIFRSTIDLRTFTLDSHTKTESAPSGTQPQTHTKSHAKLQAKLTDSAPSKTATAPLASTTTADPSAPALPVTSSTTLDQAPAAVQFSSTVNEAPDTTTSTSTLDRGASFLATSRNVAYQYHSSHEADPAPAGTSRTAQQEQKASHPNSTITVPVPATETGDPQPLVQPPAVSSTPRHDAPTVQNSSVPTQDSSATPGTDSKATLPPAIALADDTTPAPPAGSLAFAARLTPTEETPASTSTPAPDASRTTDWQSRVPTALQSATPATAKQIVAEADLPADTHGGDSGSQSEKENRFAKPEIVLPQMHATFQGQTTTAPTSHAPISTPSPAARMDQVQEPPATAPSSNRDITIRIPDSNTDQGTAVRFVERAGEVHVSVRTGDTEMAQTLRGGLNDLVNRLEDGGIRTQVWQPGTDSSTSQNDSHHPFADPDGSNGRQYSSGSNSEQESKQHNKPRWVEELEGSIGNPNFKETTQLLWQA